MQRKLSLITALTAALSFPAAAYGWGEGHWGESNTQGPGYGGSGPIPPPSAHVPGAKLDKREKLQMAQEAYKRWQQNRFKHEKRQKTLEALQRWQQNYRPDRPYGGYEGYNPRPHPQRPQVEWGGYGGGQAQTGGWGYRGRGGNGVARW